MKKFLSVTTCLMAALALVLCLTACGSSAEEPETDISDIVGEAETPADLNSQEKETSTNNYCGTWAVDYIEVDGSKFSVEEVEAMGDDSLSTVSLILKDGGKACLLEGEDVEIVDWSITSDGIKLGIRDCLIVDDLIHVAMENGTMCFKKLSDNQTIPSTDDETVLEEPVEEETVEKAASLRPEFKEAMDSYEAFYDEYCAFMEKYSENPTDLSLLGEYASMMSKSTEMTQKFDAWNSEDLNEAELSYYLEVNNRVAQKLLECAQ